MTTLDARPCALWIVALLFTLLASGCRAKTDRVIDPRSNRGFTPPALSIEYPDVATPASDDLLTTPPPLSLVRNEPAAFHDLSLEEAVRVGLANSRVLRDLGGQLLRAPQNVQTVYGPAAQESDPRFGLEAALSAFDASYSTSAFYEKNDRALNNVFFGGGTRLLQQDAFVFQNQLTKRAAGGTQLTLRQITDYDANNSPGNQFPSAWNSNIETEFRHPLLLGAGVDYNRIAGPGAVPGVYNGVLIARINADVSLADLETGVRTLLSDIENAYWDLYFAYRDLDAKLAARDTALETWRRVQSFYVTGRRGGEAEKEAHAREQYFRFEEEVQNALAGLPLDGTRTNNGSSGGTFRGNGGVQTAERRLRLLIGLPIVDGELLRPVDEPTAVPVAFDWQRAIAESLSSRVELRRQRWVVKRRELELVASRNFLQPQLDTIGRYRWRGFGDDLAGNEAGPYGNALGTLFGGDFQEWQLGAELSMPFGFRKANSAVRNAEWNLSRERAVLRELERQVVHDLGAAVAEGERAFLVVQTTYNRRVAAHQQMSAAQAAFDADQVTLDFMLESQRLMADAEVRYHRALVEHALAIKNIEFEKGSLLNYNGVGLAESPWPANAAPDYHAREVARLRVGPMSYILSPGREVAAPQVFAPPMAMEVEVPPPVAVETPAPSSIEPMPLPAVESSGS